MKRNLFVLVLSLMLLSFGLANGFDFQVEIGAGGYNDGGTMKIQTGGHFQIFVSGRNNDGYLRSVMATPYVFTGTGLNMPITWDDTSTFAQPSFSGLGWSNLFMTYAESFDGNLPDIWSVACAAGITGGFPSDNTWYLMEKFGATATLVDNGTPGTFCIAPAYDTPADDAYDWLFDDPQPTWTGTCFDVVFVPDQPPVIDNAPLEIAGQWSSTLSFAFLGHDPDATPGGLSWSVVSGPGSFTGSTWSWKPSCSDVGESITLVVCLGDAAHVCPSGTTASINIVVNNLAPEIGGACGQVIALGIETKQAQFTATDGNTGDTKAWEVVSVVGTRPFLGSAVISPTGLLTFTTTGDDLDVDWVVTVKVTDCAGASDECTITFHAISLFPYGIKIAKLEDVLQGHHAYVPVIKTDGSEDMWGFDFLFAYDASALTFVGAIAGPLFDMTGDYQWEYFTYRFGANGNCGSACPSGLLRVVGIADQNDGIHHPLSKDVPNDMILFTLDFLVSNDRTLECSYVPIRFYWMDCGDNTIAFHKASDPDPLDIKTAVSLTVQEFWGTDITDLTHTFPTYQGLPNNDGLYVNCFDSVYNDQQELKPLPERFINFVNGGIDIVCADSIDARGDVNLNGVANEIGDAVVFTNYFIAGLGAFTVNVEGQIAATDINADGLTLSVADLVYLIRVIVGDALPYAKLSPYANSINIAHTGSVVTVDAELGAAFITLAGNVEATLADGAAGMDIKTGFDGINTRVLIYSFDKGKTFSGNVLNTTGNIVSVEASDYFGSSYKVAMLPTSFAVSNYPNPFNPTATISLSLPSASNWTVTIFNVAGQKVAAYNGYSEAGTVNVTWNASEQASGIYFYKAEAGKSSVTKKMVLLK
jgi:hypothetical protein